MTSKEKADKLCMRFLIQTTTNIPYGINKAIAKECALIAVDEMIAELAYIRNYDEEIDKKMIIKINQRQDFLIEVEKEIKAL
jgi:hypothetical protein